MTTDRRAQNRRTRSLIPEPLTRKRERREDERRDSPRREIALDVREPGRKSRCLIPVDLRHVRVQSRQLLDAQRGFELLLLGVQHQQLRLPGL